MVAKDLCFELLQIKAEKTLLWINRITVLSVTLTAVLIAILNLKSQVLAWNYLSMALRGSGVFLPLSLAIFAPGRLKKSWAISSMMISTAAAVGCVILRLPLDPLSAGITVSTVIISFGLIRSGQNTETN
ncbi:MAG: sss: transporter, solute:sodium symporter family [Anaerospora sp.]|nr:sss: transporter, solute:sodium symporter family [Anaerospora sp.]